MADDIFTAVRSGSVDMVDQVLMRPDYDSNKRRQIVNTINPNGEDTPLMIACMYDDTDMVRYLLEHGADPNLSSPLIVATTEGYADIVALLVEYGASLNVRNMYDLTPLMIAIRNENVPVITVILENSRSVDDDVMLLDLSYRNSYVAKLLIEHGGNPVAVKANTLTTPLMVVSSDPRYLDSMMVLLNDSRVIESIDSMDRRKNTALYYCAASGNVYGSRMLLDKGADPNVGYILDKSVLAYPNVVDLLISYGGCKRYYDDYAYRQIQPLNIAVSYGYIDTVAVMVRYRSPSQIVDVETMLNYVDRFSDNTPLMRAASRGVCLIARILLDAGANPDIQNSDGVTALMVATIHYMVDIVELLVHYGANTDRKSVV